MMGNTTTRTVRFTAKEIEEIEVFLHENPFFDFSTLTRLAVAEFIRHPKLQVKAIKENPKKSKGRQGDVHV
jgi:oligoribonuclease (3'-5' exoribonuclease)